MKKIFLCIAITLGLLSCNHKDSLWQEVVEDLDVRIHGLELLCAEMNTNITSLQTIVDVLQSNDFITSIVEIKKDGKVVGYTIAFGKHDPITIYHGQDGKDGANGTNGTDGKDGQDGQNGADGKDGITPVIGVAQDTDGVYYWTLNGEWLLDDNGNKLPVSGKDGQNGADGTNGTDGKDGQDGADGKDGITPLLKIENGYWYISYDNGATWTESGKATGDNGQNGQNGSDGKDGQDGANGQDGVTPLLKIENGYWYISYDNGATWAQLGKATGEDGKDGANGTNGTNGTDGKDGQDGADGSNGQDGITPQLKIENGYWYVSYDNGTTWTQFGKATGADGQDGQNGSDGKDGQDGQDGKDGITPQLKIEEGYWFISYDNGTTWTQLGKATGEDGQDGKDGVDGEDGKDGQNGADGKDGQDGDSMFQSVTQDENYVYFTLADGTVIKIAKASEEHQPNSEFMFIVTYDANGGVGTMQPDTFYYGVLKEIATSTFTRDSYYFGNWNTKADGTGISYSNGQQLMISKNITLYANWKAAIENGHEFVDLGLPSGALWATMNIGATSPEKTGNKYAWGETITKSTYSWKTYKFCTFYTNSSLYYMNKYSRRSGQGDWKTALALEDDAARVNWGGQWKMPASGNLKELCEKCTWTLTTLNGTNVYKVTGPNGHSIYLLATTYWSCSLGDNEEQANALSVSNNPTVTSANRCAGLVIRPICFK